MINQDSSTGYPESSALFQNAKKKIRNGWIIGLISAFLTLLFALLGNSGVQVPGHDFNLFNLLDFFVILVCTFGIYQKSRVASTSMFIYFLGGKILIWSEQLPIAIEIIISLIFVYVFFEAMRGTFTYHKLLKNLNGQDVSDVIPQSQQKKDVLWIRAAWITAFLEAALLVILLIDEWLKTGKVDYVVWILIFGGFGFGVFRGNRRSALALIIAQWFWTARMALDVPHLVPLYILVIFIGASVVCTVGALYL